MNFKIPAKVSRHRAAHRSILVAAVILYIISLALVVYSLAVP